MLLKIIPWIPLLITLIWATIYTIKSSSNFEKSNSLYLESIPNLFTTVGVLGTFIGISIGLWNFDTNGIEDSISDLLIGLRAAFFTSIAGIVLSIIFSKWIDAISFKNAEEISSETDPIVLLSKNLIDLKNAIAGDSDQSIASQLIKLRSENRDFFQDNLKINKAIAESLVGEEDSSLSNILYRLRDDLNTANKELSDINSISKAIDSNSSELLKSFENNNHTLNEIKSTQEASVTNVNEKLSEFVSLLEKSQTEALVKAIEQVIGGFNERLNELIERLVKENFEELNNSVNALNQWQKENKEQVQSLTDQFIQVSENLGVTEKSLENMSKATNELVKDEGRLAELIIELQKVLTEETKFKESIEALNKTTEQLEDSSDKLSAWSENHKDLVEKVDGLIVALEEIERLRDNTDGFFDDIKNKLTEAVGVIAEGNERLQDDINAIEDSFNTRMDKSFRSLDQVLQAMVTEYAKQRMTNN